MRIVSPRVAIAALLVALAVPFAPTLAAETGPVPLISRDILFGNPERTSPQISPDGKRLAWLAPDEKNVLQVWVKTLGQEDGKKVTADRRRGIRTYLWAQDDRTLLYLQDSDGDENYHLYGVDLISGNVRDLTPFQGVRAAPINVSQKVRDRILVQMNLRDRKLFDVHEVNLETGALKLVAENPGDEDAWTASDDLEVRVAFARKPDASTEIRVRESPTAPWTTLLTAPFGESIGVLDLTADGEPEVVAGVQAAARDIALVKQPEAGVYRCARSVRGRDGHRHYASASGKRAEGDELAGIGHVPVVVPVKPATQHARPAGNSNIQIHGSAGSPQL